MVAQRQRSEAASHPGAAGSVFTSNGLYGEWVAGPVVHVDHPGLGVEGDGTTDDSDAVQFLIDALEPLGGRLRFGAKTYRLNIVGASGVILDGVGGYGYLPGGVNQTRFLAAGTGPVVDTPATQIFGFGIQGINFQGLGAGTACQGVRFDDVLWSFVRDCAFNNFSDEAVVATANSGACDFERILTTNCILDRTQADIIGAVDIDGADHWLSHVEAGISGSIEGTVQSANLYCVGIAVRMANGTLDACYGEISDIGIAVLGDRNRFTSCRADLNYGHGWYVDGSSNQFAACLGLNNSQDTTNTYDNFHAASTSAGNLFGECIAADILAKKARYGFYDDVSSATQKNQYDNCRSTTAVTGQYRTNASNGSAFFFPNGAAKVLTPNATTHDVTGYGLFQVTNTLATTITAFTGLVPGQRVVLFCNDDLTTIQHNGATIILLNGGNKKLRSGAFYEFMAVTPTIVREVAAFPLRAGADVGDSAKTLQARVDEERQRWDTPLTANRAVTLSTTGDHSGAEFRVTRTANATGAFALNVGTGPLKALNAGEWCDVTSDGTAWYLSAFGTL